MLKGNITNFQQQAVLSNTSDYKHIRNVLSNVLRTQSVASELEIRRLLPNIVQHLHSADPICRKLALWLVACHARHTDLLLLAINSLGILCQSPDPAQRCLALRTLTQIGDTDVGEMGVVAVQRALDDNSALVRRSAVIGAARLHLHMTQSESKQSPAESTCELLLHDRGIVDKLYTMLRDSDPIVMCNCLHALNILLTNHGGVVVNRNIHNYLLNHLATVPGAQRPIVLSLLALYMPKEEEERLGIMSACDEYLDSQNTSVAVQTFKHLILMTADLPELRNKVVHRAAKSLINFLRSPNSELVFVMLGVFQRYYLPEFVSELEDNYSVFLCSSNEPAYVKEKRIDNLCMLVCEANIDTILFNIYECAISNNIKLSQRAILALGNIAKMKEAFLPHALDKLFLVLNVNNTMTMATVFQALSVLDLHSLHETLLERLIPTLLQALEDYPENCDSSFWWLFGEYGDLSEDTCYVFEEYTKGIDNFEHIDDCLSLLNCAVKLFLKQPAQYQHILALVLELACKSSDFVVQQLSRYYSELLTADLKVAREILLNVTTDSV